jgi:hypothetical protein
MSEFDPHKTTGKGAGSLRALIKAVPDEKSDARAATHASDRAAI